MKKNYFIKFLIVIVIQFLIIMNCEAAAKECVILLHGLGRTHHSMSSLEEIIKQQNYFVINDDYPSRKNR